LLPRRPAHHVRSPILTPSAANLTNQVRSIALVTKAVAQGDLSKQIEVPASGEILALKNTVNGVFLIFFYSYIYLFVTLS
jgi:hypothetical protein